MAIAAYIGIHAAAHAHPAPGWNIGIFVAGGVAIILLLVSEPALRDRRSTLQVSRREGRNGIWIEPAVRPIVRRRARLKQEAIVGARPKPTINVRLQLLIHERKGKELVADAVTHGKEVAEADAQSWTESVTRFLGLYMHESVESFITAGEGSSSQRMAAKLAMVAKLIAKLSDEEGQRAGAGERAGELGEDRQVGMKPDPVKPTDAEGE